MNNPSSENNVLFHGRYELIERLGKGGFSTVWKAKDTMSDIEIAVKIFLKQDKEGVELCREEYKKTHNLQHPSILRPFHFDVCDNQPYIVMPFLSGGSLEKLIGTISHEQFVKLYDQISSAIGYLHSSEHQIIHGDIKPDNILMDGKGNYYLTDFGISQKLENSLTMTLGSYYDYQNSYSNKGITPMAYRAPEYFNFKNWKMMGSLPASDFWAFGVSMYQLIQGEIAFSGEGGLGQLIMMSSGDLPLSEIISLKTPFAQYEENIFQCLQLNPRDRKIIALGEKQIVPPAKVVGKKISKNNPVVKAIKSKNETPSSLGSLGYLKKAGLIGVVLLCCLVGFGFWMSQEPVAPMQEVAESSNYLEYYQSAGDEDEEDSLREDMNDELQDQDISSIVKSMNDVSTEEKVALDREEPSSFSESSSNVRIVAFSDESVEEKSKEVVKEDNYVPVANENTVSGKLNFDYGKGNSHELKVDELIPEKISVEKNAPIEIEEENSKDVEVLIDTEDDLIEANSSSDNQSSSDVGAAAFKKVNTVLNQSYYIKISPEKSYGCSDNMRKGSEYKFVIQEDVRVNDRVVFTKGKNIVGRITQIKCSSKGVLQNIGIDFRNHLLDDGTIMRFNTLKST